VEENEEYIEIRAGEYVAKLYNGTDIARLDEA